MIVRRKQYDGKVEEEKSRGARDAKRAWEVFETPRTLFLEVSTMLCQSCQCCVNVVFMLYQSVM